MLESRLVLRHIVCAYRRCREACRSVVIGLGPGCAESRPDLDVESPLAITLQQDPRIVSGTRVRTGAVFNVRGHVITDSFPGIDDVCPSFYGIDTPFSVVEGAFEGGVRNICDDRREWVLRFLAFVCRTWLKKVHWLRRNLQAYRSVVNQFDYGPKIAGCRGHMIDFEDIEIFVKRYVCSELNTFSTRRHVREKNVFKVHFNIECIIFSRNKFMFSRNKFMFSRNKFMFSRNKFMFSRNKFMFSRNKFMKLRVGDVESFDGSLRKVGRAVKDIGLLAIRSFLKTQDFGDSALVKHMRLNRRARQWRVMPPIGALDTFAFVVVSIR